MKYDFIRVGLFLLLIVTCTCPNLLFGQVKREIPKYANEESKDLVQKMIKAHGGWTTWAEATSISYDNIFYNEIAQESENPFWIVKETIEQGGAQRVHQYWPVTRSTLVYDGNETWTVDWAVNNPPKLMVYFFYYFLNLPWLTQSSNVILGPPQRIFYTNKKYEHTERSVYRISMSFKEDPVIGKVKDDTFHLYIDEETHVLVAYEYTVGYGAILDLMGLPEDVTSIGPVLRHIDQYNEVNGLLYPYQMHTTNIDQSSIYGHHALIDFRFDKSITDLNLQKPDNAKVDNSSKLREDSQ